jgi:large subunit ribosomal protein L13
MLLGSAEFYKGKTGVKSMPVGRVNSYVAKPSTIQQDWYHVDAEGQILGRLAVKIATVLMGKHKPTYTAHIDCGDFVVVTNAEKIQLTGNKLDDMTYDRYTYHAGGWKSMTAREVMARHPERIIENSVRRMLPKSALGHNMLKKLKVYVGNQHPHQAQQPQEFTF